MSTVPAPSLRASLEMATAYYSKTVHLAAQYLEGRGITADLAREYRLGVVAEPCSGHEQYVGRLAIPYLTRAGVATIRFRALDDHTEPKYLSLLKDTGRIYNTKAFFTRSPRIVLTEGEFDALIVTEYTGVPAVGLPGASSWRPIYRRCFAGYTDIRVVGDSDEAGRKFTEKITADLDNATPVHLPEGHDCNSVFLEQGPEGLAHALGL